MQKPTQELRGYQNARACLAMHKHYKPNTETRGAETRGAETRGACLVALHY